AVADEDEIASPSGRRRWGRGKPEGDLVAGVDDDDPIVNFVEQLANISVTCIVAGEVAPPSGCRREAIVNGYFRRRLVSLNHLRKTTIAKLGGFGAQALGFDRRVVESASPCEGVPVDLHIGPEPQAPRRPGAE